jgi:hypothetical protein
MTTNTILLLFSSLVFAFLIVYFQYLYKVKSRTNTILFLAFIRFLTIVGVLLLLINPILFFSSLVIQKTPLPIVVDNSSSIANLNAAQSIVTIHKQLISNEDLNSKFDVQSYQFDSELKRSNIFNFNGKQTNIEVIAKDLKSIYRNISYPLLLLSDGNQTTGSDYAFCFEPTTEVNPIVIGDTTTFPDLRIEQINTNKYAFLKNTFPVELFLSFTGSKSVSAELQILQNNKIISKQNVFFSASNKSSIQTIMLPANQFGLQVYQAVLVAKIKEKNTYNNKKNFAVDVIDQKSEIAIFSAINHPDIGALKRAIETNAQRKVTILKPNEIDNLEKFNALIFFQPTAVFKSLFLKAKTINSNSFIITGTSTDFTFLNQNQDYFEFNMSAQKEDFSADFNSDFNLFETENIGFENFPPLQNPFGTITEKGIYSTVLYSRIRTVSTKSPLLVLIEKPNNRAAFLMGENSWKWRLQSHLKNQSFDDYDRFVDKTVQFLVSNNSRKSLVVNHENFYYSKDNIEITAQYFNKNYEFDSKAQLSITLENKKTKELKRYDLLKGTSNFKVILDGLPSGNYKFKVEEFASKSSYTGSFEIIEFDIERQFASPNVSKLKQLASQTKGQIYSPNQIEKLIEKLVNDEQYKPIQKEIIKKVPLIEWKILLSFLILFLALEWFIRKYNGWL